MRTLEGRTETTRQETEETPRTEERDIEESQRRKVRIGDLNSALESLEKLELEKERGEAVERKKDIEETDIDGKIKTERESIKYLVEGITGKKIEAEINTDQEIEIEIAKRIIEEGVDPRAKEAADTEFRRIVQERGKEWEKICAEVNQEINKIKQGMGSKEKQKLLAERLLEIRKEKMGQEIRTGMIEKIRDEVNRERARVIWFETEQTAYAILAENSLTS